MDQFSSRKNLELAAAVNQPEDISLEKAASGGQNSSRAELQASIKPANNSADSIEIVAGQTTLDPLTLKKMFLLGKLTQGQLAHEMKKFNDVAADSQIRFGKKDFTQTIDFREVGRASVSNPGADLKPDQENQSITKSPPSNAKDAKKEASTSDNEKVKKDLEQKEVKLKTQEQQTTVRQLNTFTENQAEQKKQHVESDTKKREEEEINRDTIDPLETSVDRAAKTATNRPKLTKNLAAEIQKEIEKSKSGPGQSSR